MFLLHINGISKFSKNHLSHLKQLNFLKKKLINKINFLKTNKKTKSLSIVLKKNPMNNKNKISKNFIKHIIGITLSNSNTNVYISDIKGKIKHFSSAGSLGLNGKQKIKKPLVLIKLLRYVLSRAKFIKKSSVALHLRNFTEFHASLVLSLLNKYFLIEVVRIFNNKPHNGCRPKKLKRKKRRKLVFK